MLGEGSRDTDMDWKVGCLGGYAHDLGTKIRGVATTGMVWYLTEGARKTKGRLGSMTAEDHLKPARV